MSTKYKSSREVPTQALAKRLEELADAVQDNKRDEFTMRIPAECDRDADLVCGEAARRLKRLSTKIWQLEKSLKLFTDAAKAAIEWIDAVPQDIQLPAMPGFDRDIFDAALETSEDVDTAYLDKLEAVEADNKAKDRKINTLTKLLKEMVENV